jgi:aminoglycoside phosphotransferase (APT) family kinase protein
VTVLPPAGEPAADVAVTVDLVRSLLEEQHSDLAALPLHVVDSGWDNVMLRLGDELLVRMPRRLESVVCLENEQRWLPHLAPLLPVAVPAPVRVGRPGCGYPYPWSVVPWLPGASAQERPLSAAGVRELAVFLRMLHRDAPPDAPHNPYRGTPVCSLRERFHERARRVAVMGIDLAAAARRFAAGLAAPVASGRVWIHGDVHAGNVLVAEDGALAAVIDWGDVAAGDPASDLAAAWLIADDPDDFFAVYGEVTPGLRERAGAWAAYFALMFLEADPPHQTRHAGMAKAALARLSG